MKRTAVQAVLLIWSVLTLAWNGLGITGLSPVRAQEPSSPPAAEASEPADSEEPSDSEEPASPDEDATAEEADNAASEEERVAEPDAAQPADGEAEQPAAAPAEAPAQQAVPGPAIRRGPGIRIFARGQMRARAAVAQVQVQAQVAGAEAEGALDAPSVFLPVERATLQRLERAAELIESQEYAEAVRLLGGILEAPEDYFYQPDRSQPDFQSLKETARRMVGGMPAAGRDAYELEFGALARQLLDRALAEGSIDLLEGVSRNYFHTQAGYEATLLLAAHQLDHGQPLAAALSLERLIESPAAAEHYEPTLSVRQAVCYVRAGMTDEAAETLQRLRAELPEATIRVAGQSRPLFAADGNPLEWLERSVGVQSPPRLSSAEQWVMHRGGPSRNSLSDGSSPLLTRRWGMSGATNERLLEALSKVFARLMEEGQPAIPTLQPLAVNNLVFVRTVGGLMAIDFTTGKRIWRGAIDDSVQDLLEPTGEGATWADNPFTSQWLEQRCFGDATFGTLSSDGSSVFAVEDLGFAGQASVEMLKQQRVIMPNGAWLNQGLPTPHDYNRLAAYDIATEGKLLWEVGGAPGDDGLPLAGVFFLGPPLPLSGRLYVLAEEQDEVRLICLDGRTGAVQWSQQLVVLEANGLDETLRRSAGLSPSYSDGQLLCPTGAGAIVAVDLATRSLRWGFQYQRAGAGMMHQQRIFMQMNGQMPEGMGDRWRDAAITVAAGYALVTAPDSGELHCLKLVTAPGERRLQWSQPRGDDLFVGCVHDGLALLVGRSGVRSVRLADGSAGWANGPQACPDGMVPCGQGYFNGQKYFLPISSPERGEVIAIDFATGEIGARARSRSGVSPGNLVCYRGAVVSQTALGTESFYQLDELSLQVAQRLGAAPDDPVALALQGELLLDQGQVEESVRQLQRSFALAPEDETRELLVQAMCEGLRLDFGRHRAWLAEVESLAVTAQQQFNVWQLKADGLQAAGETLPAFETYLALLQHALPESPLDRVDGVLVRRERWILPRLQTLVEQATPADRTAIEQAIIGRWETAAAGASPGPVAEYLRDFGLLHRGEEARRELAARLYGTPEAVQLEWLYRRLEQSPTPGVSLEATGRMVQILRDAGRSVDVGPYREQLLGPLADVLCVDGQTGQELWDSLPLDEAAQAVLTGADHFPRGVVEVQNLQQQPQYVWVMPVEIRGDPGPFFRDRSLELEQQQLFSLVCRDRLGNEVFRLGLGQPGAGGFNAAYWPIHARVLDHLVVLWTGYEAIAIDALGAGGGPRVLWRQALTDVPVNQAGVNVIQQPMRTNWGQARMVVSNGLGRPLGNLGPVTTDYVALQRGRHLVVVEPLTGQVLWTRSDLAAGSEILGDDELLFVQAPNETVAHVFRPQDGLRLGQCAATRSDERILALGRRVLTFGYQNNKPAVTLTDLWTGETLWSREFEPNVRIWPLGTERFVAFSPDGKLQFVQIADGQLLVDQQVDPQPFLHEMFALALDDVDLVFVGQSPSVPGQPIFQNQTLGMVSVGKGMAYGFDRATGELLYATPIENQMPSPHSPPGLPGVVFGMNIYEVQPNGLGNQPYALLSCLDKRTGRIVWSERMAGNVNFCYVAASAVEPVMTMRTNMTSYSLRFTDEAWPEKDEAASDSDEEADAPVDRPEEGEFNDPFQGDGGDDADADADESADESAPEEDAAPEGDADARNAAPVPAAVEIQVQVEAVGRPLRVQIVPNPVRPAIPRAVPR